MDQYHLTTRGECYLLALDEMKRGGDIARAAVYATLAGAGEHVEAQARAWLRRRQEADQAGRQAEAEEAAEAVAAS